MKLVFSGNYDEPEIMIAGSAENLRRLGSHLVGISGTTTIAGNLKNDEVYPVVLTRLVFSREDTLNCISVSLEGDEVNFRGNLENLTILGESLINVFAEPIVEGEHMHLDSFDELLCPGSCDLVNRIS